MCLHIRFHSEPHGVKRGLAKQAEVKGQEAPGEEVKGQRPHKSTYFELAISQVGGLQESSWGYQSRARTNIQCKGQQTPREHVSG